ncbi:MAG: hypothetical protein ACRDFX_10240 [Chloroflexota bacterium]
MAETSPTFTGIPRTELEAPSRPTPVDAGLGWFPAVATLSAIGCAIVAISDALALQSARASVPLYWIGLLVIVLPCATRLGLSGVSRRERIATVLWLAVTLYLVKVLYEPSAFTIFDEFSNWRTVSDISLTNHLFSANPLERVNPEFPGLGIVTDALAKLASMPVFVSGTLVVGLARLILVLAIFAIYEAAAGSSRIAGLATLIYMANPSYPLFDAQFAYESLALPLAILTILLVMRAAGERGNARWTYTALAVITMGATVVSHHLTAYALTAFLFGWALVSALFWHRYRQWPYLLGIAILASALSGVWLVSVASAVISYLAFPFTQAATAVGQVLLGRAGPKHLNQSSTGKPEPPLSQLASYGSALSVFGIAAAGLLLRFVRRRLHPLTLIFAVFVLIYPLTLGLRLVRAATETASRSAEYVFVGLGFFAACALVAVLGTGNRQKFLMPVFLVWVAFMFAGSVTINTSPSQRQPGPYIMGGDARSVEPEGIRAALWARHYLGPGNRMIADRTNRQLMGSYGGQDPQLGNAAGSNVSTVFFTKTLTKLDKRIINADAIRYLPVDLRLSKGVPGLGIYFEGDEPDVYGRKHGIARAALTKFDHISGVNRLYDSGNIAIYDVGRFAKCLGPITDITRCSPRDPIGASWTPASKKFARAR